MADNQTQQRDQDVITYETFTGLRSDVTPERFGPGDLVVGTNIDLDKSGRIARRDGYTLARAGASHSLWADPLQQWCLCVSGNTLWQVNPDYSLTFLQTLRGGTLRMSYVRVNDRIYYANGVDSGIIECGSGAVRSWGLPVPALPMPSLTVGAMPAGSYQYALTWLRNDSQESGAPLAGSISVPAGAGLNFTLPLPTDPTVAGALLYLSTPNGEVLYVAGVIAAGVTNYLYNDDTSELNTPLATQFLGPAPSGQLVTYYRGRLYVAVGDTLYASSGFGYELFDLREYIALDGRITLLAPLTDKELYDTGKNSGFFVGTDRSCGVLVGSSPAEFQYVPKTDYGAIPGALAYVDGALFGDDSLGARPLPMWLTTQGICVGQPDMAIKNLTRSHYTIPAAGQGAAIFQAGPNRFIATANQ